MHHNKETQKEIIVMEAAVWAFWVVVFGFSYLFTTVVTL